MIFYKVIFGSVRNEEGLSNEESARDFAERNISVLEPFFEEKIGSATEDELRGDENPEALAARYIAILEQYGHVIRCLFPIYEENRLCAYLGAIGARAMDRKYLPKHGRKHLDRLVAYFGKAPQWEVLGDGVPKRETLWTNAPFLYLFTTYDDLGSPLNRGDNGMSIPLYRLPDDVDARETSYFTNSWQLAYREFESIYLSSGALEIPAYKQLADYNSALSRQGRKRCEEIERMTGVPTYYLLTRYWGRRQGEENRKCPGCGRSWRTEYPIEKDFYFQEFHFQCKKCRLVSHTAVTDEDERHARIGEWKKPGEKKSAKR